MTHPPKPRALSSISINRINADTSTGQRKPNTGLGDELKAWRPAVSPQIFSMGDSSVTPDAETGSGNDNVCLRDICTDQCAMLPDKQVGKAIALDRLSKKSVHPWY